jgi:hypothetical protein
MSEQTPTPEEEVTILVGGMTREEFLGEPERIRRNRPRWCCAPLSEAGLHHPPARKPPNVDARHCSSFRC